MILYGILFSEGWPVFVLPGLVLLLCAGGMLLDILSRAWATLACAAPRTTPSKAVGLLFVPLFNIFWLFVAIYGFAIDWNRITSQHPNLAAAPRMNRGVFLAFCATSALFPLLYAIVGRLAFLVPCVWFGLLITVVVQLCAAINFMASKPTRFAGALSLPKPRHPR